MSHAFVIGIFEGILSNILGSIPTPNGKIYAQEQCFTEELKKVTMRHSYFDTHSEL